MGLLGDVFSIGSAIAGNKAQKKKNKYEKEALDFQKGQAEKGNNVGDYLLELGKSLRNRDSGYTDAFGGGVQYNPETGEYEISLSPQEKAIQTNSYNEEAKRGTLDQDMRRTGLVDAERMRGQASGEQDQALRDIAGFRSGVGKVDPSKLAGQLLANRTQAVNAGYDDASRAANTISLRTGSAAGDALSAIARNRTRDIASTMGDPYVDALGISEQVNSNRLGGKMNTYDVFNDKAGKVYDTAFAPANYNAQGTANKFSTEANDLNWQDFVASTVGGAAGAYGGVANGMNNAQRQFSSTYNPFGTAQMLKGFGNAADNIGKDIAMAFAGGGAGGAGGGAAYDWNTMGA